MNKWIQALSRRRSTVESDLSDEIAHHIEMRADHLQQQDPSLTRQHAIEHARRDFGPQQKWKEDCREQLGYRFLDELHSDLRYAARGLQRHPGFALASILVLGIAIAANIAFFSLYENYVLRPLPMPAANRNYDLVGVTAEGRRNNSWTFDEAARISTSSAIEGMYGESTFQFQIAEPLGGQAFATSVAGDYFTLVGARPQLGRLLTPPPAANPQAVGGGDANALHVVLSDAGWRRLFQADPRVIGRTLRVRGSLLTVVGVAEPAFNGTQPVVPDLWIHARQRGVLRPDMAAFADRAGYSVILRPGVPPQHAAAELSAIATHLETRTPTTRPVRVELELRDSFLRRDADTQLAAALIFCLFLAVLLIACANLANLHLARAAARSHEIGIRLSLGASRWRLIRQLLTESTLLALCGAALGLSVANTAIGALQDYLLSAVSYSGLVVLPVEMSWRIGLFTLVVGIAAGLAFGLLPALEATSPRLVQGKRDHSASLAGRRLRPARLRAMLIVGQSAVSVILLILAALLVRNTQTLYSADPGYDVASLIDVRMDAGDDTERRQAIARIAELEPIAAVTVVSQIPLGGWRAASPFLVEDTNKQRRQVGIAANSVDENFFVTLGVGLLQGRPFTRQEAERKAPVAIISQATARALWPDDAIVLGKTIREVREEQPAAGAVYEVIGVAPDLITGFFFQGKDSSAIYFPSNQGDTILARTRRPAQTAAAIAALRSLPAVSVDPAPLQKLASMQRFPFEAAAAIAGTLGILALGLTCIGLHGVVGFVVSQRVREIGIQIALGAAPWRVVRGILAGTVAQVITGIALGLPVCIAISRLAASSPLRIQTYDWTAYLAAPLLLVSITALSCFLPATRAAAVDPMDSLRQD